MAFQAGEAPREGSSTSRWQLGLWLCSISVPLCLLQVPLIVQSIYDHLVSDCKESLRDIAIQTLLQMTRLNPQCVVSSVLRDIPWCDTCGARPPHGWLKTLGASTGQGTVAGAAPDTACFVSAGLPQSCGRRWSPNPALQRLCWRACCRNGQRPGTMALARATTAPVTWL